MLGYAGENERVLPGSPSASSDSDGPAPAIANGAGSDSDDDARFVMDPSDPRAHDKSRQPKLAVRPTREPARKRKKSKKAVGTGAAVSRWDSDSSGSGQSPGNDDEEDVGERVPVQVVFNGDINADDDSVEDEVDEELGANVDLETDADAPASKSAAADDAVKAARSSVKLSKWALSRFLVPREERTIPVFEEPPIEPLNDHILSDFSSRFRGATGDVEVARAIDDDESEDDATAQDKFTVGAPLYASSDKTESGRTSGGAGDKKAGGESKAPGRKRPENRYFVTDLATKCFNCGQIGHMSSLCMNDKVLKPCYYCGLRGHMAMACPHLPCPTCLQLGHTARDCSNRRLALDNCGVCGRVGHDDAACKNADSGLDGVTCMVCTKPGHLHCVPIPPPADRKKFCPNCADRHLLSECDSYIEPSQPNYATSNFRMAMKCFVCQNPGHMAAECPQRNGQMNHFSCFRCGQRGHYASDCTSGGDSRQTGRKRGREQFYTADYDDDADDGYYYNGSGGGRSNGKKSYGNAPVRLDAALPSYRNNGGGGGYTSRSSYTTSSSDRRRGGNGGGRWR